MRADKQEALSRLDTVHHEVRESLQIGTGPLITAQQVHGNEIGIVDTPQHQNQCFDACDGLITNQPELCLGIYVADCCAVYIVDRVHRAIGLLHSGRKGTELRIVSRAIRLMAERFGSRASDLTVQLSPCIRPPHYEVDFAARIVEDCREAGVDKVHDCGVCTACEIERYYSYRIEMGKTGRMLALMAIAF